MLSASAVAQLRQVALPSGAGSGGSAGGHVTAGPPRPSSSFAIAVQASEARSWGLSVGAGLKVMTSTVQVSASRAAKGPNTG